MGAIKKGKFEGAKPLQKPLLPLSFEGEGDKGGEVGKSIYRLNLFNVV